MQHDIDNWKGHRKVQGVRYTVQNFMNFGLQTG